jgi:hypothetical protein
MGLEPVTGANHESRLPGTKLQRPGGTLHAYLLSTIQVAQPASCKLAGTSGVVGWQDALFVRFRCAARRTCNRHA